MNARTMFAVALGAISLLVVPSVLAAQAPGDKESVAAVQAPATHQHDHGAPATDGSKAGASSCCAKMAQHDSQDVPSAATPPAQHEHDAPAQGVAKNKEEGCCSGMMKGQHEPSADQSAKTPDHSCCCGGMKM
jgi:hypothetical protein